jgi:ribose 1,5-bisphosphokinase PhnN
MTDEGGQSARGRRPLTERDAELTAIDAALTELCDTGNGPPTARRGGLLVYAGPAGSGKTSLLGEVRKKAVARGCTVLSARGGEQEHHMAFHVVRQLVQPVLAAASEEEHRRIMGSWYDIVAPAVGLVAAEGVGAPDPTGVRDGLDWLVTRFAVRYTPCVLILDDAHWTDPETLSWLAAFAPRAEELPMLVVLAYRPDELPPQGAAFRKLAERNGSRPFDLLPLTPGAVGRIVHDTLGGGADEPFRHECWAVTGGNPFEVVELLAKVRDRGLKPQQENIPELRELASAVKGSGLITRIERLGTSAVRLAYATAVLGAATTPALAARIAALGREEAADAIDRLRLARILTGGTAPDEPLDFVHPLIATSVYRSIPGALRTGMHGEAAVAVVEAGLGAAATARHLQETPAEGDPWVVTQLREAAREYLRSGAPEAARRCLARALREPPPFGARAAVL